MSAIPASDDRELVVYAEDDACREIAKELEQQHPRWIVIFGTFTWEFYSPVRRTSGIEARGDIPQSGGSADVERGAALRNPGNPV